MALFNRICCLGLLMLSSLCAHTAMAQNSTEVLDSPALPSSLAQQSLMLDLAAKDKQLIAVGSRGHILLSANSGHSWQQAQVPVRSDLTTVFIQNATLAYAAGHDGVILRSTDGGHNWQKLLDGRDLAALHLNYYRPLAEQQPERYAALLQEAELLATQGADKAWLDIYFLNDQVGFVVGAFNLMLKTEDGGTTWLPWSEYSPNPMGLHLHSITQLGQQLWITGEQGLVLKGSLDGKQLEKLEMPYQGTLFGAVAVANSVVLYGLRGHALASEDQGQTWQMLNLGTQANLTGAVVTAEQELYLSSQVGEIWYSKDTGQSFQLVPQTMAVPVMALALSSDSIFMAGWKGVKPVAVTAALHE